ncbi:ASPIC/UnbV domain-containing protein [Crocinitomix sp.]|nr:ASPIC/UnbV domain-containing protein [Crocinitomix sp.]
MKYYNWNAQRALFYKNERLNSKQSDPRLSIYNYCDELLKSGDSKTCIAELENYLNDENKPYSELINNDNYILFEMLAISYLRLGLQGEIGLGNATQIKTMNIYWQNSEKQTFNKIAINQKITVVEGETKISKSSYNYIPFSTEGKGHHHH